MRALLLLLLLTLVGCDDTPVQFAHEGVHLGMTYEEVEAARPGLRKKTSNRGGALEREGSGREVYERFDPEADVPFEAYGFEHGHLTVVMLGYGGESDLEEVVGGLTAANGKPMQNVATGGGRAVGWESASTELHLLQFPGKNDMSYEDEDGDKQKVRVTFMLFYKDRGEEGGGATRWIWLGAVLGLGLLCLGAVVTLRKRLEQGIPPTASIPFKVVASLSSLACAGGYGVGLVMEVLNASDGLVVLLTLGPALALNLRLEKDENLRGSSLRAPDDAPEAFNG